jgi:1-acyl-sn-glycerol-3-phosphate acyltransferase
MAIAAQVPIVPVTITGAAAAMRKGSPLIWPAAVTVEFGTPVPTVGKTFAQRDEIIKEIRRAIESRMTASGSA